MSIIAQTAQARVRKKRAEAEMDEMMKESEGSPMKSVLESLTMNNNQVQPIVSKSHDLNNQISKASKVPQTIEEVPFRRQDIRILNARNRRLMDRKLILFFVTFGIFLCCGGASLILLHHFYQQEYKAIRPLIVIGPVLAGAGVFSVLFSFEVCLRLYRNQRRMHDPDLDNLVNIHEIKHWMDPGLIGFGWGLYDEKDETIAIEIDAAVKD